MTTQTKPCGPWCGRPKSCCPGSISSCYHRGEGCWCSAACAWNLCRQDRLTGQAPAAPAPEAKPTRVEAFQEWKRNDGGGTYVIASTCASACPSSRPYGTGPHAHFTNGQDAPISWLTEACIFLGYAKPPAPVAVPVGLPDPTTSYAGTTPAPTRPIRREVSCDGRNWCDYARLVDGDAFESYRWRREWFDGGQFSEWGRVARRDPGRAETQGDQAGMAAAALVSR